MRAGSRVREGAGGRWTRQSDPDLGLRHWGTDPGSAIFLLWLRADPFGSDSQSSVNGVNTTSLMRILQGSELVKRLLLGIDTNIPSRRD